MHFFNIDLHISIIADMKKIFYDLGHQITDKSLSDHTWVFNRQKDSIPLLDKNKWISLTPDEMSDKFYALYKNQLNQYDGFIVTYPPVFSLLYKNFNKPIIINNPIRYEWPYSFRPEHWTQFNDFLRNGYDKKQIFLIANNLYDKYYMELFINRPVDFIPSICEYYPNGDYRAENNKFIYYSRDKIKEITNPNIVYKNDLFTSHTHYDLIKFKGIIHIPYQISYMSIFEQYTHNIPLIIPSKKLLMTIYKEKKYNVLKEVSWNNYFNKHPISSIQCKHKQDPNNYQSLESVEYWLDYADFYDKSWMPYITCFDTFDELNYIVNELDTDSISQKMRVFNQTRKKNIYNKWGSVLEKIL